MTSRLDAQRGLSLIELLVALSIFAALSGVTIGLMSVAGDSDRRITALSEQISTLERARSILRADLIQAVPRSYREPDGASVTAPFLGGPGGEAALVLDDQDMLLMAFVRDGWINPGATEPRGSLQRVMYVVRDDALIRRVRPFVDAAPATPFRDQVLLNDLTDIKISFRRSATWTEDWSVDNAPKLPLAVRLEFNHPDYGPLPQQFMVGIHE